MKVLVIGAAVVGQDAVLDTIGGDTQERSFAVLKPGRMLVAISQPPLQEVAAQLKIGAVMLKTDVSTANLQALATKIDAGQIQPFVERTYPLSEATQA